MIWLWLSSRTRRQGWQLLGQGQRLFHEQSDLLSDEAQSEFIAVLAEFRQVLCSPGSQLTIGLAADRFEAEANRLLIPFPRDSLREGFREILMAVVTILAFTTFFLQLTKIPTGSMQPTLYGITHRDLRQRTDEEIPNWSGRLWDVAVHGRWYYQTLAPTDGEIEEISDVRTIFPFITLQTIRFAGKSLVTWLPPEDLRARADIHVGQKFRQGEPIIKLRLVSGDHLLVDRMTYHFRKPQRGEIFVFKTRDIQALPQGQLYIKRLVALPNELVSINDRQHLVVNGHELTASDRHFESVYTLRSGPVDQPYLGHLNNTIAGQYRRSGLAPRFETEQSNLMVGPSAYLAMGDNTLNSFDSRAWGEVPGSNILGKCWFVYWPITDRFGWSYR